MKMDITKHTKGVNKMLFQLKAPDKDGLILNIEKDPCKAYSRFTQVAIDKMGHLFCAINQHGDILVIDVVHCKYWTIPVIHSCSVVQFSPLNDSEIIMGGHTGEVTVLNVETGKITGKLEGHEQPITSITFSKDYLCLTATNTEANIWNLRTNLNVHVLNIKENRFLKYISFMPNSNDILACFEDDIIQVWNYDSFASFKRILPSPWNKTSIKALAFTKNGRALVAGGHSATLAIFLVDVWEYVKSVKLPDYIQTIRGLEFVPEPFDGGANKILAILSGNGIIYFYNMDQFQIVNKIMAIQEILRMAVSGDGRYLSYVVTTGQVHIHLIQKHLKPGESNNKKALKYTKSSRSSLSRTRPKSNTLTLVQKQMHDMLDIDKLQKILKTFGSYPEQHRLKIWTKILELPNNIEEYKVINQHQHLETPFDDIETKYPLENKLAIKNLKRTLINICTWSPFFKNVQYLPVFVFPFVQVFQNQPVLCFEVIVTIILNWCQHWFEYHPMPPINVLAILENILMENDLKLLRHLTDIGVTSETYGWSLLEMVFTENLSRPDWLVLFDHVFSNEPAFLLMAVIAYNITNRNSLLDLKKQEDIEFFYHNQNPIDVKKFIQKTYELLDKTSDKNNPRQYLNNIRSIPKNIYPMFSDFPKAIYEQKTKESVEFNMEEEALRKEIESLKKLQEKAKQEIENTNKTLVEEERVRQLEEICKRKFENEIEHIKYERKRIADLRKKLAEEELNLLELNAKRLKASSVLEKQTRLEKIIGKIDEHKKISEIEVVQAETELLRHYSELLKNRLQIEGLLSNNNTTSNEHMVNKIIEHQQTLVNEINNINKLMDSKYYLKQLSVATGLAAMDSLIQRVENELRSPHGKPPKTIVESLQQESFELEMRVKELLNLIEEHKMQNRIDGPTKAKSLSSIEEIVEVTNYESMEDIPTKSGDKKTYNKLRRV